MQIEHYAAALILVAILNWTGRRFASAPANRLIFIATAAAPLVLWAGLIAATLARHGLATLDDPNFATLLMVAVACTAISAAAALLGQVIGRPRRGRAPSDRGS